jgi:hypothetical protein
VKRLAREELRDVALLPEGERSKFGFRYGMKAALMKMRGQVACYRPPAGALPYRARESESRRDVTQETYWKERHE